MEEVEWDVRALQEREGVDFDMMCTRRTGASRHAQHSRGDYAQHMTARSLDWSEHWNGTGLGCLRCSDC